MQQVAAEMGELAPFVPTVDRVVAIVGSKFSALRDERDEVRQNIYLELLRMVRSGKDFSACNFTAFTFACCYRYVLVGLFARNDYGFRRFSKSPSFAEPAHCPSRDGALTLGKLLDKSGLSEVEEGVLRALYFEGDTVCELAEGRRISPSYISKVRRNAICKLREAAGLPPVAVGELSRSIHPSTRPKAIRQRLRGRSA